VAWQGHRWWDPATNQRLDRHLHGLGLPVFVEPGETTAGYVFTNLVRGVKHASLELVGAGQRKVRRFSFLAPMPGLSTDFQTVRGDRLHPSEQVRDLNDEALRTWLAALPCCTLGGDRRSLGDPLNLVLVGTPEAVLPAPARRGWLVTQSIAVGALGRTIHSALLNQRKHMGLWLAPVTASGSPVWVGQISRNIAVRLTPQTITTHKIDPDLDETRWYLLQDLFFSEALERPRLNFTGDPHFTDGRRAVLWLSAKPVSYHHVTTRWPAPREQRYSV
jgi:hypothetical protein